MPQFKLEVEGQSTVTGNINLTTFPQYYRVLHDAELGSIRSCAPCPEVFNLGDPNNNNWSDKCPLNQGWQIFSFIIFCRVGYGKGPGQLTRAEFDFMAKKWTVLMDGSTAFTNGQGSDTNHNYVLGTNIYKPDIAYDKVRVCGGATITGEEALSSSGTWILKVDTFDGNSFPPDPYSIDPFTDTRIYFACIINKNGSLSRFPEFDGTSAPTPLVCPDVPVPIISDMPVYYPMWKLKKLPLGSSIPSYLSYS